MKINKDYSFISDKAEIGEGTRIWNFCNIFACKIGKYTQIGSYTEIKEGVKIGNYCRFQSYVFVSDGTKIGNYVFLGPKVTFLTDKYPTVKKAIAKKWELEKIVVNDEVTIGGGAIILPGVNIGKKAVIGAGSVVTKDVPEYAVVYGNPARIRGDISGEKYKKFGLIFEE